MGSAFDALIAEDEKKKREQQNQSPSQTGENPYDNNNDTASGGSAFDALIQSSKKQGTQEGGSAGEAFDNLMASKEKPTNAFDQPAPPTPQKKQAPTQQPQQQNLFNEVTSVAGNIANKATNMFNNGLTAVENWLNPKPAVPPPAQQQMNAAVQNINPDVKKKMEQGYLSFPSLFDNPDKVSNPSADFNPGDKVAVMRGINPIDNVITGTRDFLSYHPQALKTLAEVQNTGSAILSLPVIKDTLTPALEGIADGAARQYLNSSKQVQQVLDTQLKSQTTIEGKTLYTIGDVVGTLGAFISGGEIIKGAQLGKATLPVLFGTLGQLSANPDTTILQRAERLPVDVAAGFLMSFIPPSVFDASKGIMNGANAAYFKSVIMGAIKLGGVMGAQSLLTDLIDKKDPQQVTGDVSTAIITGGLFHIVGSAIGFLDNSITQSRSKSGTGTFTPQDLRDIANRGSMANTKMGQNIENIATQAEAQGKNVEINIDALQKTPVADKLNMDKPEGITLNAKLVDKPEELPSGKSGEEAPTNPATPEGMPNVVKQEFETPPESPEVGVYQTIKREAPTTPDTQKLHDAIDNYIKDSGVYKSPTGEAQVTPALKEITDLVDKPDVVDFTQRQVMKLPTNEDGTITLYRGTNEHDNSNRLVSASYDREHALEFVNGDESKIIETKVQPSDIKAFVGGQEAEVLIPGSKLTKAPEETPQSSAPGGETPPTETPAPAEPAKVEMVPQSEKYYTRNVENKYIESEGKAVKIMEGVDTFIHKTPEGKGYTVSEGKTGRAIGQGLTMQNAITSAKQLLESKKELVIPQIEKVVAEQGISPRYLPANQQTSKPAESGGGGSAALPEAKEPTSAEMRDRYANEDYHSLSEERKKKHNELMDKLNAEFDKGRENAVTVITKKGYAPNLEINTFKYSDGKYAAELDIGTNNAGHSYGLIGQKAYPTRGEAIAEAAVDAKRFIDREMQDTSTSKADMAILKRMDQAIAPYLPKSAIIEPNGQTNNNSRRESNKAGVPESVPLGKEQPVNANQPSAPAPQKTIQQQVDGNRYVPRDDGERSATRTALSERVDAAIAKSPKGRYEINKQVESIIDSKNDPLDPKLYTPQEKKLLALYSGYGGINKEDTGRGALDEFFTPKKVVDFVWQEVMKHIAVPNSVTQIIEPAMGTGRFLDGAPFPNKWFLGFEINKYSATISQVLHPDAVVFNKNFQELFIQNRAVRKNITPIADLVIGNPPYGEYTGLYKGMGEGLQYKTFEEYFIGRGLDLVRDNGNGYVVYVVQSSFLRGGVTLGKETIARKGELVSAYRFPNSIFKDSGTTVGTDLVIIKRADLIGGDYEDRIRNLTDDHYLQEVAPANVLGNEVEKTGRFGPEKFVEGDMSNIPLAEKPESAVAVIQPEELKRLPYDPDRLEKRVMQPGTVGNPSDKWEAQIRYKGWAADKRAFDTKEEAEKFLQTYEFKGLSSSVAEDYEGSSFDPFKRNRAIVQTPGQPAAEPALQIGDRVKYIKNGMNTLTGTIRSIDGDTASINVDQRMTAGGVPIGRIEYVPSDVLTKINEIPLQISPPETVNTEAKIKEGGLDNAEPPKSRPLPKPREAEKKLGKYFIQHTSKDKTIQITDTSGIPDAELESYKHVTTDGSVDPSFVKNLPPLERQTWYSYQDGKWYPDKAYIDGKNLYSLLDALEKDKGHITPEQYQKQSKYIKDNLPPWTFISDIKIDARHKMWDELQVNDPMRPGQTESVKSLFISALYRYPTNMMESLRTSDVVGYLTDSPVKAESEGQKKFIQNNRARVANKLLTHFLKGIDETSPGAKDRIEQYYNRSFNAYKILSHEYIPIVSPLNKTFHNKPLELNNAQRDAIGFLLSRGKGIAALDVGVGKTMTGIIATAESFNRGWGSRAVWVVPNPSVGQQWISEAKQLLPNAQIYDMTDTGKLDKLRGVKMLDKSVLVITGDGMEKIGLTEKSYLDILPEISEAVSSLELNATAREKAQEGEKSQQIVGQAMAGTFEDLTWESLGADMLTIDEAHNYNHIIGSVPSGAKEGERKINPYSGLNMTPSKRGVKAYVLGKYILKNNNQRNVYLMTATPFTNNPLEHYSMMSFVADKEMKERGVYNVREYIQAFMQMENQSVVNPAGQIVDKQVVTNFTNFDAYQQLLSNAMIKIEGEDAGIVRPKRIDKNVYLKPSEPQYTLANKLSDEYIRIAAELKKVSRFSNPELNKKLSGDKLRAMTSLVANGFSPYATKFYEGPKPDYKTFVENTPKLRSAAQMIKANLEKTKGEANAIVYIPFVGNGDLGINFHSLFKEYLTRVMKIPGDQIATITGETSRPQRLAIQDAFNEGKIKVLTGTYAIAEGLNLQTRTSDIFITSPFWNYTQFRQLAGRAWRQGNMWKAVRIHLLLSEGTGDTFVAQKIMEKERRDKIINRAVIEGKVVKNLEGDELDFEEVLGSLLSDPVQRAAMQKLGEEKALRAEIAGIGGQLQYARQLTAPHLIPEIQSNVDYAKRAYDRYKSQLESYKHTLETVADKSSEQAGDLQAEIKRTKGYADREKNNIKNGEMRIQKIKETIQRDKLTPEFIKELSDKLESKESQLRSIEEKYKVEMEEAAKKKAAMTWTPNDYQAILDKHTQENNSFFEKQLPAGNGHPGGNADVGGYADLKEIGRGQEIRSMQFPEILRLIQDVSGEPVQLKRFQKALGRTYVNEEEQKAHIALNRSLFLPEMPLEIKAKVAAHELGHLTDAMPDYTMSRGTILARLLTLRDSMKQKFGDLSNKTIRKELQELTQIWKPFDETQNKAFTQYRYSSSELYADALSVMFNDPERLKQMAPQFWKGFFDNLNQKPEVKDAFFSMWDLLTKGEDAVLSDRRKVVNESFADAEARWNVLRHEEKIKKQNFWFQLKYDFVDKNQRLIDLVRKAEKEGKIVSDNLNPEYLMDEKTMLGARYKVLLEKEINPIVQEFIKRDLPREALGEMMLYERIIAAPERENIANPFGLDKVTAAATLEKLERDLGPEATKFVREKAVQVRDVYKGLLDEAYKLGMYSEDLYNQMKNNPAYATFAVVDYLDTYISGSIIKATGTLKGVADTFTATVMKMMGTIRAIEDQRVKLTTFDFLKEYHPNELKVAETRFDANKKAQVPIESGDPNWKLVTYLDKGTVKGYYVDPYIASSLLYETHGNLNIILKTLRMLNSKWFRPIYTVVNPGFETFNLARDYFRSAMNMPGGDLFYNMARVFYGHVAALPHAIAKGFDMPDPLVMEMYEKRLFTIRYNSFMLGETNEDKQLEAILAATKVFDSKPAQRSFLTPFISTLKFIENVGDTIMALPKIAGYTALKGKMPEHEGGFFIRNYLGHSNMQTRGAQNWWSNEVFLFSRSILQAARRDFYLGFQNPKTRAGWGFRFAQLAILPKLLMFAAAMGLFGFAMKKQMDNVSEYDKTNYTIVPLGLDENGKTKYIRIPQTELNRFLGGLFWKIFNLANKDNKSPWYDSVSQLLSFTGGQLPALSPVLQSAEATREFAAGSNPYDFFRGRNIIPDTAFKAGGMDKLKPFAYWLIQNMGGNIVLGASVTEKTPGKSSWLQQMVEAPILSNLIGRWLKVSNYGQTEMMRQYNTQATAEAAQRTLVNQANMQAALTLWQKSDKSQESARQIAHNLIMQTFGGQPKGQQEITEANNILRKFKMGIVHGKVDEDTSAFIDATSNQAKLGILQHMKETMSPTDYQNLKNNLMRYKIVSPDFVKLAHHAGL